MQSSSNFVTQRATILEVCNRSGNAQLFEIEVAGKKLDQFALADGETWNVTVPNPLPGTLTIQVKEKRKVEYCG
jgi:hypothetical protein